MSHLLVVGFALVSLGIVSLALGLGSNAQTLQQCIESLSSKLGWVILSIGLLHFIMLMVFAAMGQQFTQKSGLAGRAAAEAGTGTVGQLVQLVRKNPDAE